MDVSRVLRAPRADAVTEQRADDGAMTDAAEDRPERDMPALVLRALGEDEGPEGSDGLRESSAAGVTVLHPFNVGAEETGEASSFDDAFSDEAFKARLEARGGVDLAGTAIPAPGWVRRALGPNPDESDDNAAPGDVQTVAAPIDAGSEGEEAALETPRTELLPPAEDSEPGAAEPEAVAVAEAPGLDALAAGETAAGDDAFDAAEEGDEAGAVVATEDGQALLSPAPAAAAAAAAATANENDDDAWDQDQSPADTLDAAVAALAPVPDETDEPALSAEAAPEADEMLAGEDDIAAAEEGGDATVQDPGAGRAPAPLMLSAAARALQSLRDNGNDRAPRPAPAAEAQELPQPASEPAPASEPDPQSEPATDDLGAVVRDAAPDIGETVEVPSPDGEGDGEKTGAAQADEEGAAAFHMREREEACEDDAPQEFPPAEDAFVDEPGASAKAADDARAKLKSAQKKKKGRKQPSPFAGPPLVEQITPVLLWTSVALVFGGVAWGAIDGGVSLMTMAVAGGGVFLFASLLLIARLTGAFSPLLLTGLLLRRPRAGRKKAERLAGHDVLAALGLAESMLDADVDARLVTTREGVVVYASDQYVKLSREAGIIGATGLPPRIDRLFAQATQESSKMFRLARAARGGQPADEIITQVMGREDGALWRRRFEVSVRPMADDIHLAWRLRELPVENVSDTFRTAYANYPRPVLAIERSGNIAWMNAAAGEILGVRVLRDVAFSDIVLGEAKDLTAALWEDDPEEVEARVRTRAGGQPHASVVFTPFTRAGVGEGFVCVEMAPAQEAVGNDAAAGAVGDLTEAPVGVALVEGDVGTDARLSSVNKLFATAFSAEAGHRLSQILPADALRDLGTALKGKAQGKPLTRPVDVTIGEGADAKNFRVLARPIRRRRGAYGPRQTVLYALDVSFEKRMEEDYAHDKRLSVIGKIAGSVAHDFNNFLQAMMGATEFLMRRHPAGDPSYADLVAIRENAQRARSLTQNLLAFSRKQTLRQEVLDMPELMSDFTPFVQRLVTEKVKVVVDHGRGVGAIKADRSQLELAIMNLAVNARDAMDKGGTLTLRSRRVAADEVAAFGYPQLDADLDHVLIEVADTGPGVPEDIADKIFEPFFTTKSEGKGTGLGLSTVDGIIGQLGGRIFLQNRPGEGATFRIFLPALSEEEAAAALSAAKSQRRSTETQETDDLTGKGRILIVEDEDSVRNIVVRALGMCGYEIVQACDGEEALDIISEDDKPFDVVLSDIMMPEMDGPTLVQEAGDRLQGAEIIFMSGYAETAMREKLDEIEGARYLQKPFTLKMVASVVKEAMAG